MRGGAMPDKKPAAEPSKPPPTEGTPVVVPHIDFDEPTGNPLVDIRKGYGLTPLEKRGSGAESSETDNG